MSKIKSYLFSESLEREVSVVFPKPSVLESKSPPEGTSPHRRSIQSPGNFTLTDSIARTCGEYFSLLKVINEQHQAASANASTIPQVGSVEQERSLAVIRRCHSPRTVRRRETGTQFDKRYVIVPDDDVTVDKEMWPSWWSPNSKPVQTDTLDQGQSRVHLTAQSWPPPAGNPRLRSEYVGHEDAFSDVDEVRSTSRHKHNEKRGRKSSKAKNMKIISGQQG